jgi:uncharacterized protein (DUF2126 family)
MFPPRYTFCPQQPPPYWTCAVYQRAHLKPRWMDHSYMAEAIALTCMS